jgi:hypothetical protein
LTKLAGAADAAATKKVTKICQNEINVISLRMKWKQ